MYVLLIFVCSFVFFLLALCCLFFFDIRILIVPLVSSNSTYSMKDKLYSRTEEYYKFIIKL